MLSKIKEFLINNILYVTALLALLLTFLFTVSISHFFSGVLCGLIGIVIGFIYNFKSQK